MIVALLTPSLKGSDDNDMQGTSSDDSSSTMTSLLIFSGPLLAIAPEWTKKHTGLQKKIDIK